MKLRDYQTELIENVRLQYAAGHNSVVMQLPTGGGKTVTTAYVCKSAADRGKRVIFCVHRVELLEQTSATFDGIGLAHGIIASEADYDPAPMTHIASIDTLRRRLDSVAAPDLLVLDEAHRSLCQSWLKVIKRWPDAKKLLITATPQRLDGKGLKNVATSLVLGAKLSRLVDSGHLCDARVFVPDTPDMRGVKTTGGDYQTEAAAEAMKGITGNAVEHYKKHCGMERALVFCVTREHSREVVAEFTAAGIAAAHLDGETPKGERRRIIQAFRDGEILVLSNVALFTEGFDVPDVQAAILLRPTKSLSLYLQMCGRALRPAEGKAHAVILDHAGNALRHGHPLQDREWTLEGKKPREKPKKSVHICPQCFGAFELKKHPEKCPYCGFEKPPPEKKEIEKHAGELREIKKNTPIKEAKTRADLYAMAKARGYKPGWAWHAAKEMGICK